MLRYLIKYNLLHVAPSSKLFFTVSKVPDGIKMTKEIVSLNYQKKSPFKNPFIMSCQNDSELYVWFYKAPRPKEPIVVPEPFILYRFLKKKGDGIYIYESQPKSLYAIKDGKLVGQFTFDGDMEILLAKEEYNLSSVYIHSAQEYRKEYQKALEALSLLDLKPFLNVDISRQKILHLAIEKFSYPLTAFLLLYMFISYTQAYVMERKIESLSAEYAKLKNQNSETKQAIQKHNRTVEFLNAFAAAELKGVDPFRVVHDLGKIILPGDEAKVKLVDMASSEIKIRIETKDDAIKYLKRLDAISYFDEVILENTHTKRDGTKDYTYTVKPGGL